MASWDCRWDGEEGMDGNNGREQEGVTQRRGSFGSQGAVSGGKIQGKEQGIQGHIIFSCHA